MSLKQGSRKKPAASAHVTAELAPETGIVHSSECIVCAEPLDGNTHLYTVSVCDHPETICSLCYFRFRSLQHNFSCPTCKRQLDNVICVPDSIVKYDEFTIWGDNIDGYHFDEPSKMFFPTDYFQRHISKLRQYQCRLCPQSRRDFKQLKGHYFGEHQKHICQLCHDNKQIFPAELVCYDQNAYERHIRNGDGDGSTGHPNCEFCRIRFYDSHALFIHLSREHYTCHICEQLGQKFKYFHSYQHLETHFRKDHIICEEPACLERRFVVFGNEFDFAAHNRQHHPHLATGRGVQIRFNYKAGNSGQNTPSNPTSDSNSQPTTDNPDYISRTAHFEGGLGGRAQNGEWQVEIQAMSRDPRDPNRHAHRSDAAPPSAEIQEEFPTLASTMGTSGASLGPQKWMNARSDGVNQIKQQQRANDFPSLPASSASAKQASYNKNSLVRGTIPASRSNGNLVASTANAKKASSGSGSTKFTKSSVQSAEQDEGDWNTTGYTGNYSYEYDLASAISASLADSAVSRPITSLSRTGSASQLNKPDQVQTLEEAFPALSMGPPSSTSNQKQPQQKKSQAQRPKLSNDLADAMKMIGTDPKKKKKVGSGLTVVKTLKPKAAEDTSASPHVWPPAPSVGRVTPPPPPSTGTTGIGAGPSWGRAFGGFGNNPK
jgi:hypothetical protein